MVTFTEVLNSLASDILNDNSGVKYDFNMCIANDLEYTKADFTKRHGAGRSYHFQVDSYEEGKQLALTIYQNFSGNVTEPLPAVPNYTGEEKKLYLYIHLSPVQAA